MKLKWCAIGLVAAALLTGLVCYWHATATHFPWSGSGSSLPPSVNSEDLSGNEYAEAVISWRRYRRFHDAINLILHHATIVLANVAAIALVVWAGRAAIRSIGRASERVASRAFAALRSAPAVLGALVVLYLVVVGSETELQRLWRRGAPHPALRRFREISDARKALAWPLDNGMTTAEVLAAVPDHELTPHPVSELHAKALRELPFGYRDTDSVCVLEPPKFDGDIGCWLQFRDDRLINFDRRQWEEDLRRCIAGTDTDLPIMDLVP
jgi:hypothetical protein